MAKAYIHAENNDGEISAQGIGRGLEMMVLLAHIILEASRPLDERAGKGAYLCLLARTMDKLEDEDEQEE